MAAHLSKVQKHVTIPISFLLAIFVGGQGAWAQTFVDPTRPPVSLGTSAVSEAAASAAALELQSVLISPTRKVAIINGQSVTVGEKVGESEVIMIGENEVVLRNGRDVQVLKLFPAVQKRVSAGRAGNAENRQERR